MGAGPVWTGRPAPPGACLRAGAAPPPADAPSLAARLALLPPFLLWLAIPFLPPMNHDVAGLLAFAGQWLDGAALYRDLVEVNPPLILLMNVPAVLLGRLLPWQAGPVLAFQLLLALACAGCAWLALRLLDGDAARRGPVERAATLAALPLLTLLPGYEFGQRSHVMMALALPYLALAARRAEVTAGVPAAPLPLALAAAALGALGFAIKPHDLAFPLAVEAYVLARRGPRVALRDPVPWTMVAVWAAYGAVLLLGFPDYLARAVPLALSCYADLQHAGFAEILLTDRVAPFLGALALLGWAAWRGRLGAWPAVLALAGAVSLLVTLLQGKGFGYHSLPLRMAALLLAVVVATRWLDRVLPEAPARRVARGAGPATAWGLGLLGMLGAEAPWAEWHYAGSETAAFEALFRTEAPGAPVLVLSPAVNGIYPALNYAGARNILPTMTIWPLQARFLPCPPEETLRPGGMDPEQRWFFETTAARFVAEHPRLLVVAPPQRRAGCAPLDLLEYFRQDAGFAAALAGYEPRPGVFGYRVWRRPDAVPEVPAEEEAAPPPPGPMAAAAGRAARREGAAAPPPR